MKVVFEIVECSYTFRKELQINSRKIHSVRYGIETASFIGAKVWNSLQSDLKECIPEKLDSKTALVNFVNLTSNQSTTCKLRTKRLIIYYEVDIRPMQRLECESL